MSAARGLVLLALIGGCTPSRQDLGRNDDSGTTLDGGGPSVVRIAAGRRTTMVLDGDGAVWAWGADGNGQLAISLDALPETCALPMGATRCAPRPVRVPALSGSTELGLGMEHGCALRAGRVLCWGLDTFGMLGTGSPSDNPAPAPVDVGIGDAVALGVGDWSSCAVHADGRVSCWGLALAGMFGLADAALEQCAVSLPWVTRFELPFTGGSMLPCSLTPRIVPGLTDVTAIAVGRAHLCARRGTEVVCMGGGELGQLGDGRTTGNSMVPIAVGTGTELVLGSTHTCARTGDAITCWGADGYGQTGILPAPSLCGGAACVTAPTLLPAFGTGSVLALGAGDHHTCAVVGSQAWCFGNADGDASGARDESCERGPCRTLVAGPVATGVLGAIAGGTEHTCVAAADGAVLCWGAGIGGELGDGARTMSATPVRAALVD